MTLAPAVGLGVGLGEAWSVVVVASAYVRAARVAVASKVLRCMMECRRRLIYSRVKLRCEIVMKRREGPTLLYVEGVGRQIRSRRISLQVVYNT